MAVQFGFSLTGRGALADREAITRLALHAERLGYDSIWVTDRLLIPISSSSTYPYSSTGQLPIGPDEPWLEALTGITYLLAITQRIHVGTSVLVIPYRNPVFTAKALATADYLSGGRVILGAGAGWWREEFEGVGVPFEDRGARMIEALKLMRDIWTKDRVAFEGRFFHVPESGGLRPHPVQRPHIPIWIGGHTDAALERVVQIADGWHPLGLRPPVHLYPPELTERILRLRELADAAGRDPASIVITFKAPIKFGEAAVPRAPLTGSAAQIVEDLQAYVAAGVSHFVLDFSVTTVDAMADVLDQFAADVRPHVK